ncbi:DUF6879 family protein [Streptomyces hyaluromycini]|uniref:DUF6879 family protein n=1 Tax=Streptomyces hyaluromycini TaxID=1377993 RepID=A0ABV1X7A6_9ACTN
MLDMLAGASGERLLGDAYLADFEEHFWKVGPSGFWKLERLQEFLEPLDDSWVASSQGDWRTSFALLEQRRESLSRHYDKIRAHGFETWRIRVVEPPLTDYMRWELRLLLLRDELGGYTRVIDSGRVEQFEAHGVLPELITLGDDVMYELLYDDNGLQQGGIRYSQRELIVRCREFIQRLYGEGEDIRGYFTREGLLAESEQH